MLKTFCLLVSISFALGCHTKSNTFNHVVQEIRRDDVGKTFAKTDTIKSIGEKGMLYSSRLSFDDFSENRLFYFPNPDSSIGTELEFDYLKQPIVSKILDKKTVEIDGYTFEVVKYNYNLLLSQDEESNKYYTKEYGIFLETYWKRNIFKSTQINEIDDKKLKVLIDSISNDESYLFSQVPSN